MHCALLPLCQVMPLVERVADRSKCLVSKANVNIGASARDLLATIEGPAADLEGRNKVKVDFTSILENRVPVKSCLFFK